MQDNIRRLKTYLAQGYQQQHLFNRVMLLGATTKLPDIIPSEQRTMPQSGKLHEPMGHRPAIARDNTY